MSTAMANNLVGQVLHVEDDDDDAELTSICLANARIPLALRRVRDGVECVAYLRREGAFEDAPRPDLILLDLNMPRMDGREVLDFMAQDTALRELPVVVFTTSSAEVDVSWSYQHHCNSYIVKPVGFESFQRAIRTLFDFWFSVASLPPTDDESADQSTGSA